jgi:hypothetical protein
MNQNNIAINVERVFPEHFQLIEEVIQYIDSPSFLGYHTPAYMDSLTKVLADNPLYLLAYANDKVAGFLPLRWRNGSLGPVINGLPFFGPNGGPIFTCDKSIETIAILNALVVALADLSAELKAISVVLYTPFLADPTPIKRVFNPDRIIEKFTQYIEMTKSPMQWPTRSRRAIIRAKKRACQIRIGTSEDISQLLDIYHENCAAADISLKPDEYFYQVVNHLCPAGIARFTVAERDNRIVACLITIQCGKTVSYNVPCSRFKDRTLQANSLLIDESVHYFRDCGFLYWNWEASPSREHPVYEFKSYWGSDEAAYQILIRYPYGVTVFQGVSPKDIADAYPYYFVVPFSNLEK